MDFPASTMLIQNHKSHELRVCYTPPRKRFKKNLYKPKYNINNITENLTVCFSLIVSINEYIVGDGVELDEL